MASIRKRLSQLWRRNGEKDTPKGDEQSSAAYRDSISSLDSGYSSITSHSAIDSAQQATPRNLHKAASMTFQSFSDTIRSKTRVFYVSPEKLDAKSWDLTEDTPKSHQPRSSIILSSVMSHEGHVNLDYRLESGRSSPTPMPRAAKFQWTTPTIDVKIPDSFLRDSEISEDSAHKSSTEIAYKAPTQAKLKPYGSWQLWPTPIDVALQQLSKVDLSTASVPRSPMIVDSNVNSSEDFMYDSAMFDPDSRLPPSVPEDQTPKIEESCGNNSFHEKAVSTELKSPALGLGYSPGPLPSTDAATKRKNPDNSLFSKGDGISLQGTHVTWLLPEVFQKEAEDVGMDSEGFGSSMQPNHAEMPLPFSNTTQRPIFHRTISHKAGLRDLVAASNSFLNHEGQEHGTRQPSSSVYESDEEPEAPSAETPAMGSRREWDKVRADRYNRYSVIRFLDDDEITEEDSEFGLELEKSPARRPLEDALRAITESDTNNIDQGVDLAFAEDEVAVFQEKSPEPNRKSNHRVFETTSKNLPEQTLGQYKGSRSDLAEGDLYQGFDAYEWPSPEPLMPGQSVDAEAALRRLAERKPDWSSVSSYDSEDELYIQYERPGDVTSFPALLAPFEDDQERKNAGSEELDPGLILSTHQSKIQDDRSIENCEETDPYGYYSLGSGVVWSRLSKMDAPGSTKFLEGDALDEKDECTEGILSENECSPLDESPVYLNPSPFPDLKKDSDDDNSPSSIITEHTLTNQINQLTSLATQDADPSPTSSSPSVNLYEGFWTNLGLDLKGCSVQCQIARKNAQGQGEHNTNESWSFYDNLTKGPDEIKEIKHEFDNPDRAFNAARLPRFNPIPSPAPENLIGGQGRPYHKGDSPGRTMIKKENKTNNPGASGHLRWSRKKRPVNMIGWSPSKPQNRGDQTSPGKKGVWWASDVEYIEKSSPTLSEMSNESKRKAGLSKLSLNIPKELAPKQLSERRRKWDDAEYCSNYISEGQEW